ncbi:reverse transcriptase [Phytophthora megakarya]|uniref:Reverse transcriptase n=1 Tax=Phytophthora megakarya TaxID=4795 RepID=A0A225WEN0_9STRA|nr:reverse transcriptase [Phytophthora megakarya]
MSPRQDIRDVRRRFLFKDLYWNHQYKWVRKYVRTCDVCQRVKPAPHSQAHLQPLLTPSECWEPVSMDFVFTLPRDSRRKTGIVVFVDRFSKMVLLVAVAAEVTSVQTARLFVDTVSKHHGMPSDIVSDRDPRFTARFWQEVFTLRGPQFPMSTADHPQTDEQTERGNLLVALLKRYAQSFHNWSDYLPMAEFAINNAVHALTGHTSGEGSTVALEQPQNTADTDLSAVMTRVRVRARSRHGNVSVSGAANVKNHEQATPASIKDNVSVHTPRRLTHRPGLLHTQAGTAAITHEVSVPGTDITKSHAQSGTDANPSGESVQSTDADKVNELDPVFSSQAMNFV